MNNRIIDLTEIDLQKSYFHFTNKNNLESIMMHGLLPSIGTNAFGIEKNKKIFFSIGIKGILQLFDVWIKWLINRYERSWYLSGITTKEEYQIKLNEFNKNFLNRKIFENEETKKQVFKYVYNLMINSVYLVLELKENIDFKYDDIDEAKEKSIKEKTRDYLNILYGINDNTSINMESWNMHTIANKPVDRSKIKILKINGKTDVLNIIKEIRNLVKKQEIELTLLDEFLEYIKESEKTIKMS